MENMLYFTFRCYILLPGLIYGHIQFRIGSNYSLFGRPHCLTDSNTLCANLLVNGSVKDLTVTCSTPLSGHYLSINVIATRSYRSVTLCDIIISWSVQLSFSASGWMLASWSSSRGFKSCSMLSVSFLQKGELNWWSGKGEYLVRRSSCVQSLNI